MDTNIIYNIDCVAGMNQMIDEESIDLIIADPPYFKVIGEKWDYLWRTEEDYLEWSEKWIAEAARVLRMGGSFYLFGYFRMLCFERPILTFFEADGSYHCPHLCVILPAAAVQHLLDLLFPGDHEAEGSVRCFCGTGTCHQRHFDHGSSCAGQRRCDLVCDASHGSAGHALRRFDDPQIHKGFAGRYHLCRYPPLKAMHPR